MDAADIRDAAGFLVEERAAAGQSVSIELAA
jgi:YD repeat-containing protein